MNERDPLEMLRDIGRAERASFTSSVDPQQFVTSLEAGRRRSLRRWFAGRRKAVVAILVALAAAGGGTVAWAIVRHERASAPASIGCYQSADLTGSVLVIDSDGSDPVGQCTKAWLRLLPGWGPPPTMVACRGDNGAPVVMPGSDETCVSLGLPALDPELTVEQEQFLIFKDEVTDQVLEGGCVPPGEQEALVVEALDRSNLAGWVVRVEGDYDAAQPCAIPQFDEGGRVVTILPAPDRFGGDQGDG